MKIKNDEFIVDCHYGEHKVTEKIAPGVIWCSVCGAINLTGVFEKPAMAKQQALWHWGSRKGRKS